MSFKKIIKPQKPLVRWDKIKLLVFDCDGVLTDGRIIYDSAGNETKNFDAHDGMGFILLRQTDIKTAIITGRNSSILQRRCEDLKVDYLFQGVADKLTCLKQLLDKLKLDFSNVLYMGDDWNDLGAMFSAAVSVCPADALANFRELADHVTVSSGGHGAVRECIEYVFENKGIYDQALQAYLKQLV
ncbi:MAG: HAD hydrolase family protein [Candidatus Syntrophosphaera sp.]|nr:HAD hydrolase family protein [Candidatus Syntrophosphaera sp.]